jgi:thiol:disulfide interchange protein DsbA
MTMTRRLMLGVAALLMGAVLEVAAAADATKWVEGRHYTVLRLAQPSQVPAGKVEVTEVFSYGCPACFQFQGMVEKIKAALPANAQLTYLHASWNPSESWPLFQRAFLTAQALGVADKNHGAVFNAIWDPNGPLAVVDMQTQRIKSRQPTIEDVAKFYAARGGVTAEQFVQAAKSFSVETRMKQSDALVKAYLVEGTPTMVVAGKYRINGTMLSGATDYTDLIAYLVKKESGAR